MRLPPLFGCSTCWLSKCSLTPRSALRWPDGQLVELVLGPLVAVAEQQQAAEEADSAGARLDTGDLLRPPQAAAEAEDRHKRRDQHERADRERGDRRPGAVVDPSAGPLLHLLALPVDPVEAVEGDEDAQQP